MPRNSLSSILYLSVQCYTNSYGYKFVGMIVVTRRIVYFNLQTYSWIVFCRIYFQLGKKLEKLFLPMGTSYGVRA